MNSIENKILTKIKKCRRGKEYFASGFVAYPTMITALHFV